MSHKILIVDDNKEILEVFKVFLNKKEYSVETVTSGVDAIQKASKQKYSLVLCDMIMPEISGIQTLLKKRSSLLGLRRNNAH